MLSLQEIAIVVATPKQSPAGITLESLKYTGVIPEEWELAQQPVYAKQGTQIVFKNGVAIAAQPDRIMFIEALHKKADSEFAIAQLAEKFVAVMQHIDYRALGINLRGYVEQADDETSRNYITQKLLADGSWKEFGQEPVHASVNLAYSIEDGRFSVSVNEAQIQIKDESEPKPAVLFSGNFSYGLTELEGSAKLSHLKAKIQNWQADVDAFRDLVNTKFLSGADSLSMAKEPALAGISD